LQCELLGVLSSVLDDGAMADFVWHFERQGEKRGTRYVQK